jgi:hypothetical protein
MVGFYDLARAPVDGAAVSDADGGWVVQGDQLWENPLDF